MSQIRGDDNLCWNVLKSGKAGQMAETSSLACSATHQVALPEPYQPPSHMTNYRGFTLGWWWEWCWWWVDGRGRRQRQEHLLLKQNAFFLLSAAFKTFPFSCFYSLKCQTPGSGFLSRQMNAVLMWEDGKRLFLRGVMLNLWCPQPQPSSKFVNYTSVVFAHC